MKFPHRIASSALAVAVSSVALVACTPGDDRSASSAANEDGSRLGAPSAPPTLSADAESPAATLAEFEAVCRALRDSDNEYYGTARVRTVERRIASPDLDAEARLFGTAFVGAEAVRLGDPARSAELLAEARALAERLDAPDDLKLDIVRRLALAHLRAAEVANCVGDHPDGSCILPLRPSAIHRDRAGATAAIAGYLEVLERDPLSPSAAWLLNVAAAALGEWPAAVPERFRGSARWFVPRDADFPRFEEIAMRAGLHIARPSGAGIVDDFDGDGRLDVVTTTIDPCLPMTFHRNVGRGSGASASFEDATAFAGLDAQLGGLNAVHADYDGDGDPDLLVLRGGWFGADGRIRPSLLRNRQGRFEDVTRSAGLAEDPCPSQAAAWADYDLDGDLDVYVACETSDDAPVPSKLFRNAGDGTFEDVAAEAGVLNARFAKGAAWGDYDDDGDPDLYVSNLGPNRLYENRGDGTFEDVAVALGVVEPAERSFATWFFDVDDDGDLDLFVADYAATLDEVAGGLLGLDPPARTRHRLYRNDGGRFTDIAVAAGLADPSLPMGANFGDLDNDGRLDLYLGTGTPSFESIAPNRMYRNVDGARFEDVTVAGGFGHLQKGHGVAFADLDDDGDQDVFEQLGGAYPGDAYPSVLFENPGFDRAWVRLVAVGTRSNRSAVGARVAVTAGGRTLHRVVGTGGSFGGSPLRIELGLGDAESIDAIEIRWPGSTTAERFEGARPHATWRLVEGSGRAVRIDP